MEREDTVCWWRYAEIVEAALAAAALIVLMWAARERTRLRKLATLDAQTRAQAMALLARAWRSTHRQAAARASSASLLPSLVVWV